MRVAAVGARQPHEAHFLLDLVETAASLGHRRSTAQEADFLFVWNGRGIETGGRPALYVECGWLPRWWYQVSHQGINAAHHLADPKLRRVSAERAFDVRSVLRHVQTHRPPDEFVYCDATLPATSWAPSHFALAPLQVEADTNMRHVPEAVRTPQGFVDYVEGLDLPIPVVFKQHPALAARDDRARVSGRNLLAPPSLGTSHQWLRHPGCELVITANSNVAHDALVWNRPAVVLGDGIWPRPKRKRSPFFHGFRGEIEWHHAAWHRKRHQEVLVDYISFLLGAQWMAEHARSERRVEVAMEMAVGVVA